ncbi:unnamed protein product, partial [Staurois parvus]
VSCDWSQLVTWYKAVVNSLVPCDLCDHSQISHVVSNDVTSDISLTTLHVITDWPISDHMIGTSYRGPVRRSKRPFFPMGVPKQGGSTHYTIFLRFLF